MPRAVQKQSKESIKATKTQPKKPTTKTTKKTKASKEPSKKTVTPEMIMKEKKKKRSIVEKNRAATLLRGGQKPEEGRKEIAFRTCAKAAMNESKGENVRTTAAAKKVVEALLILMTDTTGTEVKNVCRMENLIKVRAKDVETQIRSTWHPCVRDDVLQYVRHAVARYEKSKEDQRRASVEELAIDEAWREESV